MTSFSLAQHQSLTAFLIALGRQSESLPAGLQAQLPAIGQNLANRVVELPVIAASIPSLDREYRDMLAKLQQEPDASKGSSPASLVSAEHKSGSDISNSAVEILTAPDSVQSAQKMLTQESRHEQGFLHRLFHSKSGPV